MAYIKCTDGSASASNFIYETVAGGGTITATCKLNDCVVEYAPNATTSATRPGFDQATYKALSGSGEYIFVWKCTTAGTYTFTNTSSGNACWFVYPSATI